MSHIRFNRWAPYLLGVGCLVLSASAMCAQEKKSEDSGGEVLFRKADELTAGDKKDTKLTKSYAKIFTIKMTEGKAYRIDLRSKDFDSFLRIEDAAGKEVAFNDGIDFKNKIVDARIVYYVHKTGEYRLVVTTADIAATGKFVLEVRPASKEETEQAFLESKIDKLNGAPATDEKQLVQEVIKILENKGDRVTLEDARAARLVCLYMDDSDIKFLREVADRFSKIFEGSSDKRATFLGKVLRSDLKKLDLIGEEIAISGRTTSGKSFDLKKLRGKVVLVDFWATWCGPCVKEIPNIVDAYKKYHDKGFEVIGVSLDKTDDAAVKFFEDRKLPWKCINIEDSEKLADKYDVNSLPQPILVGRDGRVVSMRSRGPLLDRQLERLLNEKK